MRFYEYNRRSSLLRKMDFFLKYWKQILAICTPRSQGVPPPPLTHSICLYPVNLCYLSHWPDMKLMDVGRMHVAPNSCCIFWMFNKFRKEWSTFTQHLSMLSQIFKSKFETWSAVQKWQIHTISWAPDLAHCQLMTNFTFMYLELCFKFWFEFFVETLINVTVMH